MTRLTCLFLAGSMLWAMGCGTGDRPPTLGNPSDDIGPRREGGALDDSTTPVGGNDGGDDGGVAPADALADGSDMGAGDGADAPICNSTTDLQRDPHNCGACGHDCTALAHVASTVQCIMGTCGVTTACQSGFQHCGSDPATGCETAINDDAHCGGCLLDCRAMSRSCAAAPAGMDGGAGYACSQCPTSQALCGSPPACIDVSMSLSNCGACNHTCPAGPGATAACTGGTCGLVCMGVFSDCDRVPTNGCETDTSSDAMNCHACGTVCPPGANATAACRNGMCGLNCATGFGDCDNNTANGCEADVTSDLANCGSCGSRCSDPNARTPTCIASVCDLHCAPDYYQPRGTNTCQHIPAPRLVSPLSTSAVTTRRPTFRWLQMASGLPDDGSSGVLIEVCSDRACAHVVASIESNGSAVTPSADLPLGVLYWRGRGRLGGVTGTQSSAVWEFVDGPRNAAAPVTAAHTTQWGTMLDTNGDGYTDLAVGAPDTTSVQLSLGGATLPTTAASTVTQTSATGFGRFVTGAGDVNGDGFADFVVSTASQIAVVLGDPMTPPTAVHQTVTAGETAGGVAYAGDVNADGFADLLVGVPSGHQAVVYGGGGSGLGTTVFTTLTAPATGAAGFGRAVASAGDVNADALTDVIVGAPDAEAAFVYLNTYSAPASPVPFATAPVRLAAPAGAHGFGTSVACAGDVNGDGYLDVVVGAPTSATAYVFLGSAVGTVATAATALSGPGGSSFGFLVASAGDVDHDGFGDVLVASRGDTTAYVYRGGAAGLTATPYAQIAAPAGSAGASLTAASAGDLNNDGRADVALGDSANNHVLLYLGAGDGFPATASATLTGGNGFGASVYGAWR